MPRILIADDDFAIGMEIEEMLTALGYDVVGQSGSGEEAVKMAQDLKPDIILMDIVMPGEINGIEAAEKIKASSDIPIVFISGYGDPEYIEKAKQIEPFGYVMKPFDQKEVRAFIEIALHKRKMELKLKKAHERLKKTNRELKQEIKERKETEKALRESEETLLRSHLNLKCLLENTDDYILISDDKGSPMLFNSSYARIMKEALGIQMKPGLKPHKLLPDKDMVAFWDELHRRALRGEKFRTEYSQEIPNGDTKHFEISFTPIIENGEIKGFSELTRDITEKKQAEDALRESEEKYRQLLNHAPAGIFEVDFVKQKFVNVNDVICEYTGYTREEMLSMGPFDILTEDGKRLFSERLVKIFAGETVPETVEFKIRGKDGREFWVLLNANFLYENEKPKGATVVVHDITERVQANEALRESEEQYRTLMGNLPVAVYRNTPGPEGQFLMANPAFCKMFGFKNEEEVKDITPASFYQHPKERKEYSDNLIQKGVIKNDERTLLKRDGTPVYTSITSRVVYRKDGEVSHFDSIMVDITSRKQAEEALQESEKRFRTFIDFTSDWEFWIAPDGHHIYVSPSCERITGYSPEEFVNDPELLKKIVHPDDHSTVVNHFGEEQSLEKLPSLDFRIITRSGEERWIDHVCQAVHVADGTYLGRRGSNRDITKQKLMQEELLKANKLESLGVLAGGIAHDFNNLMTSIVGRISLAKMEMKPGSKAFQNLVKAEKASIQTTELTARLITFSKGGGPIKETASIGTLVKNSVDSSLKGSDIDARFSIPDDISLIEVDEEQMKQVIHNIITNAQEAMAGQGTINVSCENADIGAKDTLTLKDSKYVKISIKDQGPGIPEEDLIRIFDPYFSTKQMGTQKGMGLGLAISDSIVKQHDGLITVESEVDSGSTFHIYLPAAKRKVQSAKPDGVQAQSTIDNHQSSIQRILVMDDEEVVRDVSNALLTHLGYKVEVAIEGVEAIEMYGKAMASEKPFDMVILDLTNKVGMGGVETIKRLLEIDPDVRAIVATGYSTDPIISKFREHGFRSALPKPFTLNQLRTALHDAIAGK